jgi:hypothetical protein
MIAAQPILDGIMVLLLLSIFFRDLFKRSLYLWQVIGIGVLMTINGLFNIPVEEFIKNILINWAIVFVQLLIVQLWFAWKSGQWSWILDRQFGTGDLLFFLVLALFFDPISFVFFITTSLIITLLCSSIYMLIQRSKAFTIPLAGIWALFLTPLIVLKYFFRTQHYFNPEWMNLKIYGF